MRPQRLDQRVCSSRASSLRASPSLSPSHTLLRLLPRRSHAMSFVLAAECAAGSLSGSAPEDGDAGCEYRLPPKEIQEIIDVPPNPSHYISPRRDRIMFLKRRAMPTLSELAKQDKILAGIRIDPSSNKRSRMSFYYGISIHLFMDDGSLGPEKVVNGYNDNAKINFVGWSPDGQRVAFTVCYDDEVDSGSNLALWVADVESGKARPLFKSANIILNALFELYVWVNKSTLLVCTIPSSRGNPPMKPLVPFGPRIRSNEQKNTVQMRATKEMLKDMHEEELFDYYATSQLVMVSLDGTVKPFALPAVYTSLDPSPDEKYVMLTSVHRPYSSIVSYKRFPKKVELWTADGIFVREICNLPLAEDIPVAANSVRKGKRSIRWRPDMPSTLYWVEAQDGGDANVEASPRDIVYTELAKPSNGEKPQVLIKLDFRYRKTYWCCGLFALVYECWYKTRRTRTWVISPDCKNLTPQLLFERSSEDAYTNPGSPMMCRTPAGTLVIAKVKRNCEGNYILLNGRGATPKGSTPFLDLFNVNTGEKERIWESDKEKYYESIVALMSYHPECEAIIHRKMGLSYVSFGLILENLKAKRLLGNFVAHPIIFLQYIVFIYLIGLCDSYSFAILADPTIPIIGEGNQEANDRYVEQLVASVEAAVNEIVRRGKETRTLWEATDTYIKMSPFMSANQINKPILLIHGEDDSKVTTAMQSSQFYDALKGHGVPCRLVILPFERHQYVSPTDVALDYEPSTFINISNEVYIVGFCSNFFKEVQKQYAVILMGSLA
ncbi:hypothetical protein EJB05_10417 [Eragrostis curvula]|uniref:Peptidase S9 prolyl oligopeptidase catalytic domain-containing protein n=1 Tax=Eragrostis curvula TaxID=38414 RepID=A0A5J9VL28_9POAL|nr:hypothetical protein EJB05_10417 [Eragrostis curvula]